MIKLKADKETKVFILLGLYVAALVASNLLGGKLMPVGFGSRGLTVSIIMFPLLFLITDIVGEVHGKRMARKFVNVGLITLFVLLLWQWFSVVVPGAVPNDWYALYNNAYGTVFGMTITFTIASILAFFFGQYVDVIIYHAFKRIHKKRLMWVRNNLSTFAGQFIDSMIWVYIAFSPRLFDGTFTVWSLFNIVVLPYWLAKVVVAVLDTPLCYLGVRWLKGK
ncbi:queuosine precursor transporter [Candidatus Woesearchaeota archaeon]|nr:queuosine precursor transporter [Candidatus Woesearchaeota archaeon]